MSAVIPCTGAYLCDVRCVNARRRPDLHWGCPHDEEMSGRVGAGHLNFKFLDYDYRTAVEK